METRSAKSREPPKEDTSDTVMTNDDNDELTRYCNDNGSPTRKGETIILDDMPPDPPGTPTHRNNDKVVDVLQPS